MAVGARLVEGGTVNGLGERIERMAVSGLGERIERMAVSDVRNWACKDKLTRYTFPPFPRFRSLNPFNPFPKSVDSHPRNAACTAGVSSNRKSCTHSAAKPITSQAGA